LHRRKQLAGLFDRAVTLPTEINTKGVKAECRDGVLALFLPRAGIDKPLRRRISIGWLERGVNRPLTKWRMRDSLVSEQHALDSDGIGSAAGSSSGDAGDVVGTAALSWPRFL
jgi:hypothetical protein